MSIQFDGNADVVDALLALTPGAQWVYSEEDGINWLDTEQTQPTQEAIDAKIVELQADYDAKQYARDRAEAYPSIGEQLDMIFHSGVLDGSDWAAAIQAVKDANPKP